MRELTELEIEQVSGGVPWAIVGAGIGGGAYLIHTGINGGFSWAGFGGAVVAGGVTGGFSALGVGLTGAAAVNSAVHSATIGALSGAAATGVIGSLSSATSPSGGGSH